MPAHGLVPAVVVNLGARLFFGACRIFPPLFVAVCLIGVGVGVLLSFGFIAADGPGPWEPLILRGLGVGCLIFYGGLLAVLVVRLRDGSWGWFCRRLAAAFGGADPGPEPRHSDIKARPSADFSASECRPADGPA